ncbi:enhancer of split mgamma protein-like [Microplitis mediator]|uniref:enhancer of split mgamma protein-like n=1 Tax=Microplitis mediator TaxID=375433 RepID=UPI002554A0C8|nr:enhancer of split mgamma protein-like [Microplitis mediator]
MMAYDYPYPVSRTHQYKKITKPMLERKRRARINRCLEELKNLMVDALETEGENISKLEKADILELTVRHLQRLQASRASEPSSSLNEETLAESRWQSGFGQCAAEACKYLAALPGESGQKLARHLASGLQSKRKLNTSILPVQEPSLIIVSPDNYHKAGQQSLWESSSTSSTTSLPMTSRLTSSPIDSSSQYSSSEKQDMSNDNNNINNNNINNNFITNNTLPVNSQASNETECPQVSGSVDDNINRDILLSKTVIVEKIYYGNDNNESDGDEEIEIDVEKVDDTDTMWRPW